MGSGWQRTHPRIVSSTSRHCIGFQMLKKDVGILGRNPNASFCWRKSGRFLSFSWQKSKTDKIGLCHQDTTRSVSTTNLLLLNQWTGHSCWLVHFKKKSMIENEITNFQKTDYRRLQVAYCYQQLEFFPLTSWPSNFIVFRYVWVSAKPHLPSTCNAYCVNNLDYLWSMVETYLAHSESLSLSLSLV